MTNIFTLSSAALAVLSDEELEKHHEYLLNRHAGHPAGSTSHAESQAALLRVDRETSKRDIAKTDIISKKTYNINKDALEVGKTTKKWAIAAVVIAAIALIVSLVKGR